jgi:predicted dehydrogenase
MMPMMHPHPREWLHASSIQRRSFVKAASLMTMAQAWPGRPLHAQTPKSLRIGLVSAASYGHGQQPRRPGSHHGTAFLTAFNGWRENKLEGIEGSFVKSERRIPGARVTKLWDPDVKAAMKLAQACEVESVAPTPESCCEGVDAVILVDDGSGEQWQWAKRPLQSGIPVFCDKPLAMTGRDAREIATLARSLKVPFMSSSSLRFVPDILQLRQDLPDLGKVHLAQVVCGNDLIYYGIHALSMIYAVLGAGAISAMHVGRDDAHIARIRFKNDLDVVLMVGQPHKMRSGYQIQLYGSKRWKSLTPDLSHLYTYLLETWMNYLRTGKEPYPIEEEVELIAALEACQRSLESGSEVMIKDCFD